MKTFILASVFLMLFVSEALVKMMLSLVVGDFGWFDSLDRVVGDYTSESFLFSLGFRSIPYVIFILATAFLSKKLQIQEYKTVYWFWLIGMTLFIGFGYWTAQLSLFTDEHTPSTYALDFIIVPIIAIPVGPIFGIAGLLYVTFLKRLKRLLQA
ncbi:hypothetical protein LJ739_08835 [Aestuariibacter halophilus]|uniref:EXPERA domain-containing protein n=1 Tax=Fluctibacter halophilus TaxID=226011 RepID=A0ABS8G744_9ALTE|nr:hypothetical protein [Aestuariibacter halophilus]MCC2616343.1 hypothetical protein [Aestuariibacter halophilus]